MSVSDHILFTLFTNFAQTICSVILFVQQRVLNLDLDQVPGLYETCCVGSTWPTDVTVLAAARR